MTASVSKPLALNAGRRTFDWLSYVRATNGEWYGEGKASPRMADWRRQAQYTGHDSHYLFNVLSLALWLWQLLILLFSLLTQCRNGLFRHLILFFCLLSAWNLSLLYSYLAEYSPLFVLALVMCGYLLSYLTGGCVMAVKESCVCVSFCSLLSTFLRIGWAWRWGETLPALIQLFRFNCFFIINFLRRFFFVLISWFFICGGCHGECSWVHHPTGTGC